jgi:hypothetical protein
MRSTLAALLMLALLPSAAAAATAPTASTGGASQVTQTGATLTGTVNPQGSATTYSFEYGTAVTYGARTADVAAGSGTKNVTATAAVSALAPATRYHYRIVARSAAGVARGADRVFTTDKQPLGLTLSATPNPVVFGGGATLSGNLSGTGNAGQAVRFQQNPFPYAGGFQNVGNALVTDAAGNFSLPLLTVPQTTQYRVVLENRPGIVSPILFVPVAVKVVARVSHTRVKRGRSVSFSGYIRPARPGAQVAIQKLSHGRWVVVAGTATRTGTPSSARFSKSVRVRTGGHYRVFVNLQGDYSPNISREFLVHSYR